MKHINPLSNTIFRIHCVPISYKNDLKRPRRIWLDLSSRISRSKEGNKVLHQSEMKKQWKSFWDRKYLKTKNPINLWSFQRSWIKGIKATRWNKWHLLNRKKGWILKVQWRQQERLKDDQVRWIESSQQLLLSNYNRIISDRRQLRLLRLEILFLRISDASRIISFIKRY